MEKEDIVESPRKRLKTDDSATPQDNELVPALTGGASGGSGGGHAAAKTTKEADVGITEFVSTDTPGFEGILKKRYTDFLVNEILPSGDVLHLRSADVPLSISSKPEKSAEKEEKKEEPKENPAEVKKQDQPAATEAEAAPEPFQLADDDVELLKSLFGDDISQQLIDFHTRVRGAPKAAPGKFGQVNGGVVDDKDTRTKMHMTLRRVFNSLLSSETDKDNNMIITATPNRHKRAPKGFRGETGNRNERSKWDELPGQYLHFTIYKENKDTMEVISFLARMLKMNGRSFQFAGTKDRRGVTVQRACVFKVFAERLASINKTLRSAMLGDFEYSKQGLELGELNGNEFVITLRECQFPASDDDSQSPLERAKGLIETAMHNLRARGYLNYYGLQRFGTYSKGTHETGIKMLQSDFKGAVDTILDYSPRVLAAALGTEAESAGSFISSDDKARAEAIHIFNTTRNVNKALDKLPRKFTAEMSIMRHLGRSGNDYLGALQTVPRNLRLMYVHAYQSLVWNHAASERWRLYGDKVVEGDLVIINKDEEKPADETVDADGEVIITPQTGDSATAVDDAFTRARPLSAEEAASGKHTIFDIVLPTPGFDILYPPNQMTEFYKRFMASEQGGGLDPFDMRRKRRDIGMSGSYRTLLSRPGAAYSYQVKAYEQDDQQLVETDLECLKRGKGEVDEVQPQPESGDKIAAVLKFQLGAGQYATMALRELMKLGGVKEYKPEFMGR